LKADEHSWVADQVNLRACRISAQSQLHPPVSQVSMLQLLPSEMASLQARESKDQGPAYGYIAHYTLVAQQSRTSIHLGNQLLPRPSCRQATHSTSESEVVWLRTFISNAHKEAAKTMDLPSGNNADYHHQHLTCILRTFRMQASYSFRTCHTAHGLGRSPLMMAKMPAWYCQQSDLAV